MVLLLTASHGHAGDYTIGVFYYPGWWSASHNWKDLKGLKDSRSPGIPWHDREPLLGHYPEEEPWVAEKHIEWASRYGIDFFAYDWYWDGKKPEYEHALRNYLRAPNKSKMRFCLLWANHFPIPVNYPQFDAMVAFWLAGYFADPSYFTLAGKPVVFIFSDEQLSANARKFGATSSTLLKRANTLAKAKGFPGIYFVLTTNELPSGALEKRLLEQGYNAYTGWNYVMAKGGRTDVYETMVQAYQDYYAAASGTGRVLPYFVPASPGYDERPWHGSRAAVRTGSTPLLFERMLRGAKRLIDDPGTHPKILMIEAWNEFGEGSYIEPTKKWGFQFLEKIDALFSRTSTTRQ